MFNGLYLPRESQHIDTHTFLDHAKPNCHSFELYKGILDEKSRAVFNGRIFVHQQAQQTDAVQSNKNNVATSALPLPESANSSPWETFKTFITPNTIDSPAATRT